jgi:hypothetical protein
VFRFTFEQVCVCVFNAFLLNERSCSSSLNLVNRQNQNLHLDNVIPEYVTAIFKLCPQGICCVLKYLGQ